MHYQSCVWLFVVQGKKKRKSRSAQIKRKRSSKGKSYSSWGFTHAQRRGPQTSPKSFSCMCYCAGSACEWVCVHHRNKCDQTNILCNLSSDPEFINRRLCAVYFRRLIISLYIFLRQETSRVSTTRYLKAHMRSQRIPNESGKSGIKENSILFCYFHFYLEKQQKKGSSRLSLCK